MRHANFGLGINAGHDLNLKNIEFFLLNSKLIGSITGRPICESLYGT